MEIREHSSLEGVELSEGDASFLFERHSKHLKVDPVNGKWTLRSGSFVGLIKLPSGLEIVIRPKIKITNLLYIVSYTYDVVDLKYLDKREVTEDKALLEIYAIVLLNWIELLFKKGLYKTYIDREGGLRRVRGKIVVVRNLYSTARMWCEYDDLSYSTVENRIIKAFLYYMLRLPLTSMTHQRVLSYVRLLSDIEDFELSAELFRTVKYNRLNTHYRIIIELCALIYSNMFLKDESGKRVFSGFMTDMDMVFQRFVLRVLQKHLPGVNVRPSLMSDWATPYQDDRYLPVIRPDILVENQLVLDTKYYNSPLNDRGKLHSDHVYQILTYMQAYRLNGVLVYPEPESEFDLTYLFKGLDFNVRTFPLNIEVQKMGEAIDEFVGAIKSLFTHLGEAQTAA